MKTELENNLPQIFETVLFTKINTDQFGKLKASEGLQMLNSVCKEWGLNIKYLNHYKISKKILLNQIKNN